MDNSDILLLAQGAGYADAEIDKYTNVIAINKNKHGAWSVFILDCADTRERLCENLKISFQLSPAKPDEWLVYAQIGLHMKFCTTKEEIHRAINTVALAIMRERAE